MNGSSQGARPTDVEAGETNLRDRMGVSVDATTVRLPQSLEETPAPRIGKVIDARAILRERPDLREHKSRVLDLAYEEFCQRLEAGEDVDRDSFCQRFAGYQSSLRRQIEAHDYIEKNPQLLAGLHSPEKLQPGDSFLGFTLLNRLGKGAFAQVFLARQHAFGNRQVVVKISCQDMKEAMILGQLNHPNIVPVYSVHDDELTGLNAICMPYLGNCTLCDVLDRAFPDGAAVNARKPSRADSILKSLNRPDLPPFDPADRCSPDRLLRTGTYVDGVAHLARQLAGALAIMHEKKIYHYDLKPSNVLLTADGKPMLLDFNLSADGLRGGQQQGGTLPYMSPEQVRATLPAKAEKPTIDGRSDLFSLGVIIYELLAGVHPFGPFSLQASHLQTRDLLLQRHGLSIKPLRSLNPDVSPEFASVVESCLAYEPKDRPASAADLERALGRLLSPWQRARRWVKRHPAIAGSVSMAFAAMLLAGLLYWVNLAPFSVRQYQSGLALYKAGQAQQAIECFNRALQADKNWVEATFARGRAHQILGDYNLAFADYQRAAKLSPSGKSEACIAYCFAKLNLPSSAILPSKKAIDADFKNAAVYNNLGVCYRRLSNMTAAQECLDQAIGLDSKLQSAYLTRAEVLKSLIGAGQKGRVTDMLADLEKAIEIGPETTHLISTAATFYAMEAEDDEDRIRRALELLNKALDLGELPDFFRRSPSFARFIAAHSVQCNEILSRARTAVVISKTEQLVDPLIGTNE